MPRCEMCGEEKDDLHTAKVSGAELDVCDSCVQFGTQLDEGSDEDSTSTKYSTSSNSNGGNRTQRNQSGQPLGAQRLAMDYGQRIRKARESAGYSVDDLADELNEKANHLRKIEQEERQPDNNLQATLESFLAIDLTMDDLPSSRGDMNLDSDNRSR